MNVRCMHCIRYDICFFRCLIGTQALCEKTNINFCLGYKKKWWKFWIKEK